jgi:hypothetical protein
MIFKPKVWQAIALVLAAVNLVAAGFAAAASESRHAVTHIVLGAAFGFWAWWLRGQAPRNEPQPGLDALQAEVSSLRRELTETQERLDFAERMLAQRPQQRQVGPER